MYIFIPVFIRNVQNFSLCFKFPIQYFAWLKYKCKNSRFLMLLYRLRRVLPEISSWKGNEL